MENVSKIIGGVVLFVMLIVGIALIVAFPTKWLWNWLMTDLFNLQTITAWQALGLNILAGIFFRTTINNKKK